MNYVFVFENIHDLLLFLTEITEQAHLFGYDFGVDIPAHGIHDVYSACDKVCFVCPDEMVTSFAIKIAYLSRHCKYFAVVGVSQFSVIMAPPFNALSTTTRQSTIPATILFRCGK